MPRQARKESGTGIYHVMLRGINRQDIFEEAEDYMRMLSCLQQMLEQYDALRLGALSSLMSMARARKEYE